MSRKVLSNRAIVICAALVTLLAVTAGWLLLTLYSSGTQADQIRLESIRTVGTIVLGAGGAIALLLAARRQQTAEQDLVEKRRDLAHKERAQRHVEQVAADNYAHQQRVADASERDAIERRITELYTKAADQLGSGNSAVRLAGLYAFERLAQSHSDHRQTIVDVICAYLRMPFVPPVTPFNGNRRQPESHGLDNPDTSTDLSSADQGPESSGAVNENRARLEEMQVRLTAEHIIMRHLWLGEPEYAKPAVLGGPTVTERPPPLEGTAPPGVRSAPDTYWPDIDLNLAGAHLQSLSLWRCRIREADFSGATIVGRTNCNQAIFTGSAWFNQTRFLGSASFDLGFFAKGAAFSGATFAESASFDATVFAGIVALSSVTFAGHVSFQHATSLRGRSGFLMLSEGARVINYREENGYVWPPGWTVASSESGVAHLVRFTPNDN
jgi:hypothetical protein